MYRWVDGSQNLIVFYSCQAAAQGSKAAVNGISIEPFLWGELFGVFRKDISGICDMSVLKLIITSSRYLLIDEIDIAICHDMSCFF